MAWELWWVTRTQSVEVSVFASKREAKNVAESLAGKLTWTESVAVGTALDDDQALLVAKARVDPMGERGNGEYVIAHASGSADFATAYPEDRNHRLVPIVDAAIRARKYLAYQYTNSKRQTHPALLRPTGWRTFEHDHYWAGGYTLCVVGHCYHHNEERYYAIRRMRDVRVLTTPKQELVRLGWADRIGPNRS